VIYIKKFGELILLIGILIIILLAVAIIMNIIPKNSHLIATLFVISLIFIGIGISIKKANRYL